MTACSYLERVVSLTDEISHVWSLVLTIFIQISAREWKTLLLLHRLIITHCLLSINSSEFLADNGRSQTVVLHSLLRRKHAESSSCKQLRCKHITQCEKVSETSIDSYPICKPTPVLRIIKKAFGGKPTCHCNSFFNRLYSLPDTLI